MQHANLRIRYTVKPKLGYYFRDPPTEERTPPLEALAKILPGPTGREAQAWKYLGRLVERGVIAASDQAWYMRAMYPSRLPGFLEGLGGADQPVEQPRRPGDHLEEEPERLALILRLKSGDLAG
jgi:hypothetical protein